MMSFRSPMVRFHCSSPLKVAPLVFVLELISFLPFLLAFQASVMNHVRGEEGFWVSTLDKSTSFFELWLIISTRRVLLSFLSSIQFRGARMEGGERVGLTVE